MFLSEKYFIILREKIEIILNEYWDPKFKYIKNGISPVTYILFYRVQLEGSKHWHW